MTNPIRTGSKTKYIIFLLSMLIIPILHFLVFWVYINIDTIRLTFYVYRFKEYIFKGFYNYQEVWRKLFIVKSPSERYMFLNTFRAIIINLIILPIAIITAYAFYKKVYGEKAFRVIFYLPSIISIVVQCEAFVAMFNTTGYIGPYAKLHEIMGISHEWLDVGPSGNYIWPVIYVFCILAGLGTNVILMSSAMLRIPTSITEAAELDGCSFYRELFTITLPLIMPTITTWLTLLLASVFGFVMQPMLIAGSSGFEGRIYTIPWFIFNIVATGAKSGIPAGATYGVILSIIVMPMVFLMRWVCKKFTPEVSF